RLSNQGVGALDDRPGISQFGFLDGHALPEAAGRTMGPPAVADEALVQMNMTIDESRDHQTLLEIDDLSWHVFRQFGTDVSNNPIADREIDPVTRGRDGIDEDTFSHSGPL